MNIISFFKRISKLGRKTSPKNLILEYLIVFQKSGLPIFSKCFGDFCGVLLVDETLLSGFLSAMTTMPTFFGKKETNLNAVEMGYTKLLFSHTLPSGHVICLGFEKHSLTPQNEKKIAFLFEKINNFIESDYKDLEWSMVSTEEIKPILEKLLEKIINPWIHFSVGYTKEHQKECPICIDGYIFRGEHQEGLKMPIWKRLSDIYTMGRKIKEDEIPHQRDLFKERGLL